MAQGLKVFRSIHEAKNAGYEFYDRSNEVFLVRKKTLDGWALALVEMTHETREDPRHA